MASAINAGDVAAGLGVRTPAESDVAIAPVFGPESPGPYKHPASVAEFHNGDLYIAYYGGAGEYDPKTAVYGSRRPSGSTTWSPPMVIADTPMYSDGNAVIWESPDQVVWLFYVVRYGDTWSHSIIQAKLSYDLGKTWTDPMVLSLKKGMMVRGRPIVNRSGDYLLPVYLETGNDREAVGADSSSLFLYFDHEKKTWQQTNPIRSRIGNIQPAVDIIDGDHLVAFCRRGGGYDARKDGMIVRTESRDGGRSWSGGVDTTFPNPNAAVDFIRLRSGKHLLVFNNSFSDRSPLTLALSTDQTQTFPFQRDIAVGNDSFAYPYIVQAADGKLVLVFTSNERTVINLATFAESAIESPKYRLPSR
ncbi:exo-alpha-sialidase [bacterium]|nr:exo-alpha-sialidase [bacterium]